MGYGKGRTPVGGEHGVAIIGGGGAGLAAAAAAAEAGRDLAGSAFGFAINSGRIAGERAAAFDRSKKEERS